MQALTLLMTMTRNPAGSRKQLGKRVFDLVVGAFLFFVTLPAMGLVAWIIRRETSGPALYLHDRLGCGGKVFRCYKFRTMYQDGEKRLAGRIEGDPNARWEWEVYRKLKLSDPRVSPVGRFLRRWSLDELPQLVNVLKGEMSLIGPRPYLPEERSLAESELETILQVRPGMTGLWQVSGRNDVPFRERVRMEVCYVRNRSLWLDLTIVIRTLKSVLERKGAY